VTTRAEPRAFNGGDTIEATPEKGLMAAFEEAKPGDLILLRPGLYRGPFELKKSGMPGKPIVFADRPMARRSSKARASAASHGS